MGRGLQTKKHYCFTCQKHVVDAAVARGFLHDTDLGGCGDKVTELTTQNRLRMAINTLGDIEKNHEWNNGRYGKASAILDIIGRRP